MKENLISIGMALLLASLIFFGLLINFDSFDTLQTNVIGSDQELLLGDIVVEIFENKIEVVANKDINTVAAMSIMFLRNQNEVIPDFDAIVAEGNAEITEEYESRVTLFVNNLVGVKKDEIIISIPLNGDVTQISVSDIVLLFTDDSSERASVSTR